MKIFPAKRENFYCHPLDEAATYHKKWQIYKFVKYLY